MIYFYLFPFQATASQFFSHYNFRIIILYWNKDSMICNQATFSLFFFLLGSSGIWKYSQTSSIVIWTRSDIPASVSSPSTAAHRSSATIISAPSIGTRSTATWFSCRLFNVYRCSLEIRIVKSFDRRRCVFLSRHVYETITIHYVALCYFAKTKEQLAELVIPTVLWQTPYEYFCLPLKNPNQVCVH